MMRNKLKLKLIILQIFIVLFISSCTEIILISTGATITTGIYKWFDGTIEKNYHKKMYETFNATISACNDLHIKILHQKYNNLASYIEALQYTNTNVRIQLLSKSNNITTVKIRFGVIGNIQLSEQLHQKIIHYL